MTYFDPIPVQKDPFGVNVKVENLLFEFIENIDQLIANVVKVLKFQMDLLLRTFQRTKITKVLRIAKQAGVFRL